MIVEAGFVNHWKTEALGSVVGVEAALRGLLQLWGYCQTRKAWEFQLTPLKLAGICGFKGDAQVLWDTMRELAFIDPTDELGWFQVHEWGQMNAGLVGQWAGGARVKGATWHPRGFVVLPGDSKGGRTSGSTRGETSGSAPASGSASASGGSDRIGEDRIGEEAKATPVVPRGTGSSGSGSGSKSATKAEIIAIYEAYPKRVGRGSALKAVEKVLKGGEIDVATLLERVTMFAQAVASWPAEDHKFIPHPATWMNAGRYDDDPAEWQRSGFENGRFSEKKEGGAAGPVRKASEEPAWDWRGAALELWPDARLEGSWDQLPSSTRYELRELRRKKIEGAGAADFPWAAVFTDHLGWDLARGVEWVDLPPEQRKELRAAWSALSKDAKAAMWELSTGGGCDHE